MEAHEYRHLLSVNGKTELEKRLWECDTGKVKRIIKQKLIENQDIRTLIDNPNLKDTDDYSDYMFTNIFPFLIVPTTITDKMNYILFKVDDADDNYYEMQRRDNPIIKPVHIEFMVLVFKDNIRTDFGVERHDALAFVIKQIFAWSDNIFPFRLRCISDIEGVTDNNFATRTLEFEIQMPNNLTNTRRENPYGN